MKRTTTCIAALVVLFLLFAVGAGDPAPIASIDEPETALSTEASAEAGIPQSQTMSMGEVFDYLLRSQHSVAQAGKPSTTGWSGTMRVHCLSTDADGALVDVSFPDLRRDPPGPTPTGSVVLQVANGGVVKAWHSDATDLDQFTMLLFAVRGLQFPTGISGEVDLEDETGRWRHRVASEPTRLLRQKLEIDASDEMLGKVVLVESFGEAAVAGAVIERSYTREVTRLDGVVELTSTFELRCDLVRRFMATGGVTRIPTELCATWPRPCTAESEGPPQSLDELIAELLSMSGRAGFLADRATYETFLALSKTLAADPACAAALLSRLQSDLRPPTTPVELTSLLISALAQGAKLGGPWCAAGMKTLVQDAEVEVSGMAVRSSHVMRECPWTVVSDVVQAIEAQMGTSGGAAIAGDGALAIGSLLSDAPSSEAQATVERMRDRVDSLTWLSTLGNTRRESLTLEPALWFLENGDAEERVRAAEILAVCRSSKAGAAIARALVAEADPAVLPAIIRAAAEHPTQATLDVLCDIASRVDSEPRVRESALESIAAWPPSARRTAALEWSRTSDPDAHVRAAAARLLQLP